MSPEPAPGVSRTVLLTGLFALAVLLAVIIPALVLGGEGGEEAGSPQDLVDAAGDGGDGPVPLAERLGTDERAPLPEEELAAFADGPPRATSDYRGTPLVVNFWASWCGPCVEEMPDLEELAESTQGRLAVLGVNRADDPVAAQELVAELGIDYDLAVDGDDSLFTDVEAFGMPTTLFVDADGTIVHRRTGALTAEEFEAVVAEELGVQVSAAADGPLTWRFHVALGTVAVM